MVPCPRGAETAPTRREDATRGRERDDRASVATADDSHERTRGVRRWRERAWECTAGLAKTLPRPMPRARAAARGDADERRARLDGRDPDSPRESGPKRPSMTRRSLFLHSGPVHMVGRSFQTSKPSSLSSHRARLVELVELVSSPSLVFFWPRRAIVCVFTSTCFPVSWVGSPPTRASPPPRLCFPSCASRPRRDPRVSPLASAPPPSPAPVSSATPRRAARPAQEPCSEVLPDARCTPWERVRGPTRRAIVRRR